ncbi:MAG: hypothetical protein KDK99_13830 [Verrucomicrobiales bacterium]|nr:hypothetical protein [Verrucomicrobiales bacterium]
MLRALPSLAGFTAVLAVGCFMVSCSTVPSGSSSMVDLWWDDDFEGQMGSRLKREVVMPRYVVAANQMRVTERNRHQSALAVQASGQVLLKTLGNKEVKARANGIQISSQGAVLSGWPAIVMGKTVTRATSAATRVTIHPDGEVQWVGPSREDTRNPADRKVEKPKPEPEPAPAPQKRTRSSRREREAVTETPKPETESAKPESKRPEPQPEPRSEPKPAPLPEPKPAPRAEPKPAPRVEPAPVPKPGKRPIPEQLPLARPVPTAPAQPKATEPAKPVPAKPTPAPAKPADAPAKPAAPAKKAEEPDSPTLRPDLLPKMRLPDE